jgi:glycosyltransferase involved in cell wall biosynthesis
LIGGEGIRISSPFGAWLARLADDELRSRMGRNARATVETRFSEAAMIDRYERTLLELHDSGSRRALTSRGMDSARRS